MCREEVRVKTTEETFRREWCVPNLLKTTEVPRPSRDPCPVLVIGTSRPRILCDRCHTTTIISNRGMCRGTKER